jgi:hypothetical protein
MIIKERRNVVAGIRKVNYKSWECGKEKGWL